MEMKEKKNSVTKNTLYNIANNIMKIAFPMLTIPYISRILGPNNLGKINFIQAIASYFVIIAGLGIPFYANREVSRVKDDSSKRSKFFFEIEILHLFTVLIIGIIYFILVFNIPQLFNNNIKLSLILGLSILISTIDIKWFYQGLERFDVVSKALMFSKIISLALIFWFIRTQKDYYNYALIIIITNLIFNFLMILKTRNFVNLSSINIKTLNLRRHFKHVSWFFFAQLAILVYTSLDRVMIGYIQTETQVGYYFAANRLVKLMVSIIISISAVLLPKIAYLKQNGNMRKIKKYLKMSISFVLFFALPATVGLIILSDQIIPLVFGVGYKSIMTLKILAPLLVVIGLNNIYGVQILLSFDKEKVFSLIVISSAIFNFGLNLFLINKIGFNGAAISTLIAEILSTVCEYIYIRRKFKSFKSIYDIKELVKIIVSTLVMFLYLIVVKEWFFIQFNALLAMLIIIFTSIVVYGASLSLQQSSMLSWLMKKNQKLVDRILNII